MAIALSILNALIEGNLVERCFKLVNLLTAPLFVLFFLALFVPWANAVGCLAGTGGERSRPPWPSPSRTTWG